jgi:K(+)-stimulated pyrophosphate-energized sodium pump
MLRPGSRIQLSNPTQAPDHIRGTDAMTEPVFWIAPIAAIVALIFAWRFFTQMRSEDEGTDVMVTIGGHVRSGAMAYLKQQYKIMLGVFVVVAGLFAYLAYGLKVQSPWLPVTFVFGGFFSALAGYFGMQTATLASTRTAAAARNSLPDALRIAFRSGAVMGLVVVGTRPCEPGVLVPAGVHHDPRRGPDRGPPAWC